MKNKKQVIALSIIILLALSTICILFFQKPKAGKTKENSTISSIPTPEITVAPTEAVITDTPLENEEVSLIESTSPIFNLTDYFYTTDVVLEITSPIEKAGMIYYTLDGSEPTKSSSPYPSSGIKLKEGDKQLVQEMEPFYQNPHEESWDVNGYIVKAKIYYNDGTESPTRVHTYFVNKKINTRYKNYVLSISGEFEDLTHKKTGILAGASGLHGKDSERKAHAELLTANGELIFSQYIGMRPYGGASRGNTIKSFKMYARKDAGSEKGKFNVPGELFNTEASDGSLLDSYDRLVVRSGGNDFDFGFMRDEMNHTLMRMAGYPITEKSVPVIVYVNGEYYGILWLHENYCDDYFKDLFPNENASGEFVILEGKETEKSAGDNPNELEEAAIAEYQEFYNDIIKKDLTVDSNYEELKAKIDVENYLDYFAFNIYIANNDWPNNNYKCFRYMPGEGEALGAGMYDGRWRYLPHDMDFGQNLYYSSEHPKDADRTTGSKNDSVARVCDPKNDKYAPLFAALMEREDCKAYFYEKINTLGTTVLSYDTVSSVMKEIIDKQESELDIYLPLIRKLSKNEWWPSKDSVNENYKMIKQFHKERLDYLLDYSESDENKK